jgi:hypothetical protein
MSREKIPRKFNFWRRETLLPERCSPHFSSRRVQGSLTAERPSPAGFLVALTAEAMHPKGQCVLCTMGMSVGSRPAGRGIDRRTAVHRLRSVG